MQEDHMYVKVKPFSGKLFQEGDSSNFEPYLIISYENQRFFTSISKNSGSLPYWTDTFIFRVPSECYFDVQCWNYNIDLESKSSRQEGFIGKSGLDFNNKKKTLSWITFHNSKDEKTFELLLEVEPIDDDQITDGLKKLNSTCSIQEDSSHQMKVLEEIKNNNTQLKKDLREKKKTLLDLKRRKYNEELVRLNQEMYYETNGFYENQYPPNLILGGGPLSPVMYYQNAIPINFPM